MPGATVGRHAPRGIPPLRTTKEPTLSTATERTIVLAGRRVPAVVLLGLGALLVAWLAIVYFAEPWGTSLLPSGMDARCYWVPTLADPYLHSTWTDQIAYPYSPAFLQLLTPIRLLPWQVFMAIWAAILMAAMTYLTGPRLILLGSRVLRADGDLGRQHRDARGRRRSCSASAGPAAWSFVLLTKITPGIGLLWFVVRREWRIAGHCARRHRGGRGRLVRADAGRLASLAAGAGQQRGQERRRGQPSRSRS